MDDEKRFTIMAFRIKNDLHFAGSHKTLRSSSGLTNVTVFGVHDWFVTTLLCIDDVTLSFRVYGIFCHI